MFGKGGGWAGNTLSHSGTFPELITVCLSNQGIVLNDLGAACLIGEDGNVMQKGVEVKEFEGAFTRLPASTLTVCRFLL